MDNKIKEHQFKASDLRKFADGGVIASNIIMQLGGFSRLQIMLGAYNFVDLKNGLSFKIKNPKANFIKIILNGKDLYDIEIGRIRGTTYKVVYSQEDVYAVDLRKIIEKHTGMYMAFKDGGDIVLEDAYNRDEYTDEETLIYAQSYKLANGGITAMEVLEAREFVGEKDWVKMKPKERLAATRYLIRTGKIGYYAYAHGGTTKSRPAHKSSYTKKYKVKYLVGYSDEEEGLKYYEEFYYADNKDVAALEVFEHLQRQGYTHIEILSIALMADKGMEVQSDEQLTQKYRKLKGNVPDWFRDMPTKYKEEIIEEIEEGYEDEKPEGDEFAMGGSIESKRQKVVDYYINNEDDEVLNFEYGVNERALENRDKYYKEIYEKISSQLEDEEIYYKFRELNIDEASEEPEDYAHGGKIEVKIKQRLSKSFELPLQMAIYVPSTKDKNIVISKEELAYRVKVVEKYLATLFGGFNSAKVDGGFQSVDKGVINEDAVRVVAFANPEGFEPKFEKLVNKVKEWCRLWSQESIGLEFENDLFYIEQDSKFAKGGKVKDPHPDYPDFVSMQYKMGGDIQWGEDLGNGFSVGNDVYITDSKSMYKGKTGFVSGLAGKDLLVTISENGNERSIVVSKKGVEKLDAPMADGGEVDEEDSLDYNSISDLQAERNRLVRWKYQYNSKGADYKIKKLEERIEYLKSKDSKMAKGGELSSKELSANPYIKAIETNKPIFRYINGKAVRITKDDLKKLYSIFFNNHGTLESFADKNEIAIEYAKDIVIAGQYYTEQDKKMADGGMTYSNYEMVLIATELEKDGGYKHKFRYLVSAKDINEAKNIVTEQWYEEMSNSDLSIVNVMSDEEYRLNYMGKMAKGGEMAKKPAKFKDKVKAISKSLEGKKVPKRVRKDYGATYDKKESIDAAKRIAGTMVKKERKRYGI